ncbi:MAG: rhodanese-like domain-containing protein [Bacteroidales bacterium]|nr:MAG: rhodanese-like domain-containing protein [Bacteroidales bacterium]
MKGELFSGKCFLSGGFLNLTPRDAYFEAVNCEAVIVDVREDYLTGYKRFKAPLIAYIPLSSLDARLNELPFDIPLIIADSAGLRSHEAMILMIEKGYTNITNLAGGIVEWERDGLPLETDFKEQLDGSCMCQLKPRNKLKAKE